MVMDLGFQPPNERFNPVLESGHSLSTDDLSVENTANALNGLVEVVETTREGKTEVIAGKGKIDEELHTPGGDTLRFRISSEAFFQTNTEMAEVLYGVASDLAGLSGREKVFDLFSGIGTIALTLSLQAGLFPTSGRGDWRNLVLPALTLGAFAMASIARLTRQIHAPAQRHVVPLRS